MDEVAKLPVETRAELFFEASNRLGLELSIVEKDFWVCWILQKLFSIPRIESSLIFKGGTSLSKVYKVIDRFSEDVDISISRESLGFGAELSPEKADTRKEAERRIEALVVECKRRIVDTLLPELMTTLSMIRNVPNAEEGSWNLEIDPTDAQTILFAYPTSAKAGGGAAYISPIVRIELGARSDGWPVEKKTITPYAHEVLPDIFKDGQVRVRALSAERTFWEKATILHAEAHRPPEKPTPNRFSRHYYDLFKLFQSEISSRALRMHDLRERVVQHKGLFFRAGWAKYNLAVPGSFKLIPNESRLGDLSTDYRKMHSMIFKDLPSFAAVIDGLQELESLINRNA